MNVLAPWRVSSLQQLSMSTFFPGLRIRQVLPWRHSRYQRICSGIYRETKETERQNCCFSSELSSSKYSEFMANCFFCAVLKMNNRRPSIIKGGFQEGPLLHSQQQQQSFHAREISMTSGKCGNKDDNKI